MTENGSFTVSLERIRKYEFKVGFDWQDLPPIVADEPKPLGDQKGPNASRLLGAAVGNCLSASLLFCLERSKAEVRNLKTSVTGFMTRNEKGRLRVGKIDVKIEIDTSPEDSKRLKRCLELFEDYCVVSASVRKGIDIGVVVSDTTGQQLYHRPGDQHP